MHTWGKGYCGALGHGDETDKTTPEHLVCLGNNIVVQVLSFPRFGGSLLNRNKIK